MGPVRVLLCGTNYGRFYLEALRMREEVYQLAGILARGSQRSHELAASAGVRLLQSANDVVDCDLACFAIGSSGSDIIPELLGRGIHVLCEHPRRKDLVANALQCALRQNVCFHVNGHFGELPAPKAFISRTRDDGLPLYLNVTATDRSLYGVLDIVRRSLGQLHAEELGIPLRSGAFVTIPASLRGIPMTLQIQDRSVENSQDLADRSQDYLVDFRIEAVYRTGTLSLLSLAGPVVWNRNYNCATAEDVLWSYVGEPHSLTPQQLKRERILANLAAIDRLAQHIQGHLPSNEQSPEHILEVAEVWELLCEKLRSHRSGVVQQPNI